MHGAIDTINFALVVGSGLVLTGIMTSLIAMRFGAPLLLIFLVVGMLAGEDGPGGIQFSDFGTTYLVGSLALAVVLFDGGLRTRLSSLKGVWVPSLLLATIGVLITASIVAVAAVSFFDLSPLEGLLIGSVVSSTDAAAVFFLLRQGGIKLRRRLNRTLEVESGTNDPFALFMTIVLTEILINKDGNAGWTIAATLAEQLSIGALIGLGGGYVISLVLSRIELPSGLHPIFAATGAVLLYAVAGIAGGSGFLAVYLAGLVVGIGAGVDKAQARKSVWRDAIERLPDVTAHRKAGEHEAFDLEPIRQLDQRAGDVIHRQVLCRRKRNVQFRLPEARQIRNYHPA